MKNIVFVLLLLAIAVACKKSSDNPSGNTADNLMGSYKITSVKVTVFGQAIEVIDSIPACQRDDIYELKANNVYNLVDAGTTCTPTTNSTGTWTVNADTLTLDSQPFVIQSFNGTTLILKGEEDYQGQSFEGDITFIKQ